MPLHSRTIKIIYYFYYYEIARTRERGTGEWAKELLLRLCCVKNGIQEPKIDGRILYERLSSSNSDFFSLHFIFNSPKNMNTSIFVYGLVFDYWNWWTFKFILWTMYNFKLFLFSRFKRTDSRFILIFVSWVLDICI